MIAAVLADSQQRVRSVKGDKCADWASRNGATLRHIPAFSQAL